MGKKLAIILTSVFVGLAAIGGGSYYGYTTISANNDFPEEEYYLCVEEEQAVLPAKYITSQPEFIMENESIALTDQHGRVVGQQAGTTTLTCKDGIFTYETKVVVRDHEFSEATCTEASICGLCGKEGEAALGHVDAEPKCAEAVLCERCGEVLHEALGHDFTKPTCTEDSVCTRCGEPGEEKALGHDYTTSETSTATIYTCSRCGDSYQKAKVVAPDASAYASKVIELVNAERAKEGLAALSYDATLTSAAQVRANEIISKFSHERPDGSRCFTAMDQAGCSYVTAGENIAAGQKSPEAVVNAWMNSSGHRANIMNSAYGRIGVGFVYDSSSGYKYYWTQFFAN